MHIKKSIKFNKESITEPTSTEEPKGKVSLMKSRADNLEDYTTEGRIRNRLRAKKLRKKLKNSRDVYIKMKGMESDSFSAKPFRDNLKKTLDSYKKSLKRLH